MTSTIIRGQKADLTKTNPGLDRIVVGMGWQASPGVDLDFSAFLLGADSKAAADEDLIFYGNPAGAGGAMQLQTGSRSAYAGVTDNEQVSLSLRGVPAAYERIAFTLTLYEGEKRRQNFAGVNGVYLRIIDERGGSELVRFTLDKTSGVETAIVVGELYRYNGEWKFSAVGSGYTGGLEALCRSFGIEVQTEPDPVPPSAPAPTPTPAPPAPRPANPAPTPSPAPPAQPPSGANPSPLNLGRPSQQGGGTPPAPQGAQDGASPRVLPPPPGARPAPAPQAGAPSASSPSASPQPSAPSLQKIELKKRGDKISLEKKAGTDSIGEILINLNWNQRQGTGFFGKTSGVDLDLGCLFELKDGYKGTVQALGRAFGSLHDEPYVMLDGDDRTGTKAGGENMRINGAHLRDIKRIVVYAFIYDGAANWAQADGVVTIKGGGPDIVVRMDEHASRKGMCAIAMITNVGDQTFSIERLVEYFSGHRELDQAYGWGLRWTTGSK
ncbi:TerD family protein [Saccharibacillus alkalitolerans]|uniref:Tellurium resistance protein TerA n=1 Tax=Saccharibacillus alkalitolerans TaxID=2705290 RepID=A0ABX0F4L3_9BACL|nr:TerD domain-containing protein [Saccharibacillus alkalitolerans]NGZ74869.1 tellurium resistance protein TerA [Saccharibacillus alkalitolerans]